MSNTSIVFSGVQPTGNLHIGNYLGAIKNWVQIQDIYDHCLFCVVDLHAITAEYDNTKFSHVTLQTAITLLACGIDPQKSLLFVQSHVPQHTSLMWLLASVTPYGDLTRMTQFKDKSLQHSQNINAGLFTYPILMAADMLSYKATHIPVGQDQLQHLELTREIAKRFNERFQCNIFPLPQPLIPNPVRIRGLDGKSKMSKSLHNYIALLDTKEEITQKIKKAVTDPARIKRTDPGNPSICNIFSLHNEFSPKDKVNQINNDCQKATIGCADCKSCLVFHINELLEPIRDKYNAYQQQTSLVQDILHQSSLEAAKQAEITYNETLQVMGFYGSPSKNAF